MPRSKLPAVNEGAFTRAVVRLARGLGYQCYHTTFSIRSEPGYPDLHLVRIIVEPGEVITRSLFAELKTATGKLTEHQVKWLDILSMAGHECYLWRPGERNNQAIADVLQADADPGPEAYGRWLPPDPEILNPVTLYRWEYGDIPVQQSRGRRR